MKKKNFSYLILILLLACKGRTENVIKKTEPRMYTEEHRPQFHFSPPEKWMNDPNGLVYNEEVYHLFYQYYPEDIVWGPMHWGHAISKDMVHWEHKSIALYPDEHGLIFSGSAVVDRKNTSGFGTDGKIPLVAIFTYHSEEGEEAGRNDFQTQGIAYSLDNGDTWKKFEGNPVIGNNEIKDFRDPKVFWHDDSESWILALVAGDHAKFYSSKNLKEWQYLSDFGKTVGAHGGVWECPDLFPLKVEGSDEEKWVLIISINPGAPNGGSGTQYFIGDFDGVRFTSDQKKPKWLDHGTDNYAGVTYNNTPKGERVFIGWMSNWDYARDTPTKKWRGAMTSPRYLSLRKMGEEYFLTNYPLKQVFELVKSDTNKKIMVPPNASDTFYFNGLNQSQTCFKTSSKDFKITFKNSLNETLELTLDYKNNTFVLDRTHSGIVDFQPDFEHKKHNMPIGVLNEEFEVNILLDWSSVEVFIDHGLYVMTEQIFPTEPFDQLVIENYDDQSQISNGFIKKVESVW